MGAKLTSLVLSSCTVVFGVWAELLAIPEVLSSVALLFMGDGQLPLDFFSLRGRAIYRPVSVKLLASLLAMNLRTSTIVLQRKKNSQKSLKEIIGSVALTGK
jgi:hypothetical protein